jgi:hypothetical protein
VTKHIEQQRYGSNFWRFIVIANSVVVRVLGLLLYDSDFCQFRLLCVYVCMLGCGQRLNVTVSWPLIPAILFL